MTVLLWDQEMRPHRGRLDDLDGPTRLRLAVQAIEWMLAGFSPSYADVFLPQTADYVQDWLVKAHEATAAGMANIPTPSVDLAVEAIGDLLDSEDALGAPSLLMAIADTLGLSPEGMDPEILYTTLSHVYQSQLEREQLPVETIEAEQADPALRAVIATQIGMLDSVS